MELVHIRRINEQNADLFVVANTAVEEVRALVGEWESDYLGGLAFKQAASALDAIVAKYDAAVTSLTGSNHATKR